MYIHLKLVCNHSSPPDVSYSTNQSRATCSVHLIWQTKQEGKECITKGVTYNKHPNMKRDAWLKLTAFSRASLFIFRHLSYVTPFEKLRAYCSDIYTVFSTELQIGSCFWFCLHIARWCPHLGVPLGTMRWQVTLTNHPDQRSLPHTNQTPQDQVWARCTVMCFDNFSFGGFLSKK